MSTHLAEYRKMSLKALEQEIAKKHGTYAKVNLGIRLSSEKNTAKSRKERKMIAQMLTVLNEKRAAELKPDENVSTLASSKIDSKSSSSSKKSDSSKKSS